jgi:uncharacterized protein YrrD
MSEIIGKPVVSAESGDRLGSVSDGLIELGGLNVAALVLRGGLLATERVLRFGGVQTLGGDTVLARAGAAIETPDEWHRSAIRTVRASDLTGKPVVTAGGQRLGEISDLIVNDRTGSFDGIEVSARHLAGLHKKRMPLPITRDTRIGADAVIVPDEAVEAFDRGRRSSEKNHSPAPRDV